MKKHILFLLLVLFSTGAYAQCISIELSIEWGKDKNVFSEKSDTICIPYLTITYRNITDTPLYFLKVSGTRMELPEFLWGSIMYRDRDLYKNAMAYSCYSNNVYRVEIGGGAYYGQPWMVINDTITAEEIEIDPINDALADIYLYLYQLKNTIPEPDTALYLNYKARDITERGILTKFKDQFVFLKRGEVYIDRYNLIGFTMVGGEFNFGIWVDSLYGFVYTEPMWNKKQEKWIYGTADLPAKVKEYNLYKGAFFSNSIGVKFKGRLSKE